MRECDCDSACSRCLKHYRNQFVHSSLDRYAALQLLEWGRSGLLPKQLKAEEQLYEISSLVDIMAHYEIDIRQDASVIRLCSRGKEKKLVIYPYMLNAPRSADTLFISDYLVRYAKPYAISIILSALK